MKIKIFVVSLFLVVGLGFNSIGQDGSNDPIDTEDCGGGTIKGLEIVCTAWPATEGRCFKCRFVQMNGTRWVCVYTGSTLYYCTDNSCGNA